MRGYVYGAVILTLPILALGCGQDEARSGAAPSGGGSGRPSSGRDERGEPEPLAKGGGGSTPVQWRAPEGSGGSGSRGGGGGGGGGRGERITRDNLDELPPGAMTEDEAEKAAAEIAKADRGDGEPCDKAYEAFGEMLAAYQEETPSAPRRKPERGTFMDMCESLPATMQRCLLPDYLKSHRDECEGVRKTFGGQMEGLASAGATQGDNRGQ